MTETAYQLTFDGETLRYTPPDSLGWEVHISKILIIGESTYGGRGLGNVPSMCIADRAGKFCFCPIKTPGFRVAIGGLSRALKMELRFDGSKSRACESRVVAPHYHCDKPMFDFETVPAQGLFNRLFRGPAVVPHLTQEMLDFVVAEAREAAQLPRSTAIRPTVVRPTPPAAPGRRRAGQSARFQPSV
jgi:hypothetical protein